jgi:L-lactate utilization protein LutC
MSFLKKLFKTKEASNKIVAKKLKVNLSLDDAFVHHFITKGGKFLYCISEKEIINNLDRIISENNWDVITCFDKSLKNFLKKSNVNLQEELDNKKPFFTCCEHLISDNGDILFSSNQLSTYKIASLTNDFIVFAKTSQFVKDTGEGLTGIKTNCKDGSIPTNISAIKKYSLNIDDDNFLNYGNNNSKNLYLLLLEDL